MYLTGFTKSVGLIQDGVKLDDIRATDRNKQPPDEGIMCELLWSDPQPMFGRAPSKRGVGCQFGPDVTRKFLADNNLDYIVRSHEVGSLIMLVFKHVYSNQGFKGAS